MSKKIACGYEDRQGRKCGGVATEDDYCSECGQFICEAHIEAPYGDHDPSDHIECSVCGEPGHFDGECDE